MRENITLRAVIVGLIACFIIGAGEVFSSLVVRDSFLCSDFSTGGAIALLFFLVLLNAFIRLSGRNWGLSPAELTTVTIMMLVGCALPSWGVMLLFTLLPGAYYYALPTNRWSTLFHPYFKKWLFPQGEKAITGFFEGLAPGQAIPWSAWTKPLIAWVPFILAFYLLTISIVILLRKRWVEEEKLLFPLAILPTEMTKQEKNSPFPALFRNKLAWFGFAVPFLINSLNGLHSYFHFLPQINLFFPLTLFRKTINVPVRILFEVIGIAYLLTKDVSLSLWFFPLIFLLETGIGNITGFSLGALEPFSWPGNQIVSYQAIGGMIAYLFLSLFTSRKYLKRIFLKAIGKREDIDDSQEALSYRSAFLLLFVSGLFVFFWILTSGLPPLATIIFLFFTLIIFTTLTRIVAQTGLPYGRTPVIPQVLTVRTLGSEAIGNQGMASLGLTYGWASDIRTSVMASTANGLKLTDNQNLNRRKILFPVILAILVSLFASLFALLLFSYRTGAINSGTWQTSSWPTYPWNWAKEYILHPEGFGKAQFGFIGLGMGVMFLLTFFRNYFLWWPLHPVGFALGFGSPASQCWFSFFLAWLIKSLILKYGGSTIYKNSKHFFLGLFLGAFVSQAVWIVIDYLARGGGNRFLIS